MVAHANPTDAATSAPPAPAAMDFLFVLGKVCRSLDSAGVRYALIGGFAMALRGVQRATVDLDFMLMLEDLEHADAVLRSVGYRREYHSENVSHYVSDAAPLGRIDLLHAFRGRSVGMLARAERIAVADGLDLPVVQVEDIIGLKVQAACNDETRADSDWTDIRSLVETQARLGQRLDWELIGDYLGLFQRDHKLTIIEDWYGKAHRH
jgi:predicted nucleotidyltransferase